MRWGRDEGLISAWYHASHGAGAEYHRDSSPVAYVCLLLRVCEGCLFLPPWYAVAAVWVAGAVVEAAAVAVVETTVSGGDTTTVAGAGPHHATIHTPTITPTTTTGTTKRVTRATDAADAAAPSCCDFLGQPSITIYKIYILIIIYILNIYLFPSLYHSM